MAEVLEAPVYDRLKVDYEPRISPYQYAHQRGGGTEYHLIELHHVITQARAEGKRENLAALDVHAAFDRVPHNKELQTLSDWGTNGHILRYLRTWVEQRSFAIRLQSLAGVLYSRHRSITRGHRSIRPLPSCGWYISTQKGRNDTRQSEAISTQ